MKRLIAAASLVAISAVYVNAANDSYRQAALEAARWIRSSVVKTEHGKAWPSDPTDAKSVGTSLYARIKPDLLVAQTGYMQGAAGIGMLLLRVDDIERNKKPAITFPDSPF